MSELTRCNYCSLQHLYRRAKERGVKLVFGTEDGWVTVRFSDEDRVVAHFLALSDHCVC